MKMLASGVLALLGAVGLAHARPVFVENVSTITNPAPALWTRFAVDVAVSGGYALIGAERDDFSDPQQSRLHQTAFLYRRAGSGWALVRQLDERVVNYGVPRHQLTVALSPTLAAISSTPMMIYDLSNGWVLAPSDVPANGVDSPDLEIDGNRIINGEFEDCAPGAAIIEKGADGVWRRSNTLVTPNQDCANENIGIAAALSGNWAVVTEGRPSGVFQNEHRSWIFRRSPSAGWIRHDFVGVPIEPTLFSFYSQAAIRGTDVFLSGGLRTGIHRYRPDASWNFQLAENLRPTDGSMGGNDTAQLELDGRLLLQKTTLWDRSYMPSVINVWQRQNDGTHEHVAALVHRDDVEWGMPGYEQPANNIAISGRTVLATGGGGRVFHFELPESFGVPAPRQDTFNGSSMGDWTPTFGSLFYSTVRGDRSRVLRQTSLDLDTRAIYKPADWTSEAIEVDVKATQFADSNSAISLITRYQGEHNYFEFVWGPTRFEFRRMASGTLRTLVSYPGAGFNSIQAGQNRRVRLESVGTRHQVYIDGRQVLSISATGPTRGRMGVSTYRATVDFDNALFTPSPQTSIYRNDFATNEPVPWVLAGGGQWSIDEGNDSNYWLAQYNSVVATSATIGTPSAEQRVEASARVVGFDLAGQHLWFGVVARYVDESNYYALGLTNSNRLVLFKRVNGVDTWLGSYVVNVVQNQVYDIRLDAVGDELRAYLDDRLLFEARDSTHPVGTAGMATNKAEAQFESFTAYQP